MVCMDATKEAVLIPCYHLCGPLSPSRSASSFSLQAHSNHPLTHALRLLGSFCRGGTSQGSASAGSDHLYRLYRQIFSRLAPGVGLRPVPVIIRYTNYAPLSPCHSFTQTVLPVPVGVRDRVVQLLVSIFGGVVSSAWGGWEGAPRCVCRACGLKLQALPHGRCPVCRQEIREVHRVYT